MKILDRLIGSLRGCCQLLPDIRRGGDARYTMADIGLSGQVRRVGTDEAPGYRILLGGRVTEGGARFGQYVAKAPAKVSLIGPDRISQRFDHENSKGVYKGLDDFVDDVVTHHTLEVQHPTQSREACV